MAAAKTAVRRKTGKTYWSPFTGYQFIVRPSEEIYSGSVVTGRIRELVADFAIHRPEFRYINGDGVETIAPDIAGHFFDLDAQAEQKEWTAAEVDLVEKRLDWACERYPDQVKLWTKAPAPLPWPTYDSTDPDQVVVIATATGMVGAALEYERENQNRKKVVDALIAVVAQEEPAAAPVEESELAATA